MPTKKIAKKPSYRIPPPRPRRASGTRSVDTIGSQRTRAMLNADIKQAKAERGNTDDHLKYIPAWNKDGYLSKAAPKPKLGSIGSATRSADTIGSRRTRSMLNADMRMAKRIGQADDHMKQYGAWNKDAKVTAEIKRAAAKRAETAKKKAAGAKTAAKKQGYR